MAFRFPLKALWRVRAIYEKRERQRLEIVTRQLIQTQRQLVTLRQDRLARAGWLANSLKEGMTGAELQFEAVGLAARQRRINAVAQAVEDLSEQHREQLTKYRQAHQKVEIMERLHQRRLSAYRRNQARNDQQQATDLFLIRSHTVNDG